MRNPIDRHLLSTYAWHWLLAFVWLVALLSGIAQLTGVTMTILRSVSVFLACTLLALLYAIHKSKRLHLPIEDVEPCIVPGSQRCYTLCCPCDRLSSLAANGIAHKHYGSENINFDRYEQWRIKNKNILVCLRSPSGDMLGYFDVLPMKKGALNDLLSGRITEQEITYDDVLNPRSAERCPKLYLSGLAVREPETFVGKRSASLLVWGLMRYLQHFFPMDIEREIFALGFSDQGQELLKRYGFKPVGQKTLRRDRHQLYAMSINERSIGQILATIPDWSNICALSWMGDACKDATADLVGRAAKPGK